MSVEDKSTISETADMLKFKAGDRLYFPLELPLPYLTLAEMSLVGDTAQLQAFVG